MCVKTEAYCKPEEGSFCINIGKDIKAEEHTHDFIEIFYITKGSATQTVNGVSCFARRGSVLCVNCGQTHSHESTGYVEYYSLMITPKLISDYYSKFKRTHEMLSLPTFDEFKASLFGAYPCVELKGDELYEVDMLFSALFREYTNNRTGRDVLLDTYLKSILIHIFRSLYEREEKIVTMKLPDYIREHCGEHITLQSLADRYFYNPSYLSRMFRKYHGVTLTEYLTEERLKKAMYLIENTVQPLEEIIPACGFTDRTAFFKKFRSFAGCSPLEYRKKTIR